MEIKIILPNVTISIPSKFNVEFIIMRVMILAGRNVGKRFGQEGGPGPIIKEYFADLSTIRNMVKNRCQGRCKFILTRYRLSLCFNFVLCSLQAARIALPLCINHPFYRILMHQHKYTAIGIEFEVSII